MTQAGVAPAIELINVTKRYGEAIALDGVSLRIESGEFFCLLGPSGCGKTTTLNLIGGFIPLTSGELRIEGQRVNDLPPHRRDVNTVFQNYALFPHMSVADNVAFGLRMESLAGNEIDRRVAEYLELVGLAEYRDRFPGQLSGGQAQRVALARALAKRPAVLLLDEPLGALDLKLRKQMQVELSRIHRQVGTTFVFVTHDQEEALSMATRIAVMAGGHVRQIGSPREIYQGPVDRFVADFIGESNFLDGRVAEDGQGTRFELSNGRIVPTPTNAGAARNGRVALMIRPESVGVG
ncbi:MAG: spermidine/putrescine transport system ATP-binding protein, partial [Chloroflexota bacterium]|nr:spermidine/putrescine transport system ATP-binding protein [Chloroflexota bacterium]